MFGVLIWQVKLIPTLFNHVLCWFTWSFMTWEAADENNSDNIHKGGGWCTTWGKENNERERKKQKSSKLRCHYWVVFFQTVFRNNKLPGNWHDGLPANSQCVNDKSITMKTDTSAKECAYKQTYVPNWATSDNVSNYCWTWRPVQKRAAHFPTIIQSLHLLLTEIFIYSIKTLF